MTPEGKVKASINKILEHAVKAGQIYKFMPVPGGFGPSSLDYLLCVGGLFVAIEAKKPGGKLTPRQIYTIRTIKDAGGKVFVIDGPVSLVELIEFLSWVLDKPRSPQDIRKWPK